MIVSAFLTSFLVAEVIISALEKTASAVPAQSDRRSAQRHVQVVVPFGVGICEITRTL